MRFNLLLLGAGLLGLAACAGPEGPKGDPGDDGEQGDPGGTGSAGQNGEQGEEGTDGEDGEDGDDGQDGRDGHSGDGPWGFDVEIVDVEGASGSAGQFLPGDVPVVTFRVDDDDGVPYDLSELTGLSFQIAGPIGHYQIANYYADLTDTKTASVDNGDGTFTYTFLVPIPETYHAVPNDTSDLGEDEGDLGGQPLVDGTYTLAMWAYLRQYRQDGTSYYDAANATADLLVGSSATALETREVTLDENCASCHGDSFYAHGGSRREVKVCQTCHVSGGEDRYSATDPSTTPGANIGWNVMIHKIHAGEELENGVVYNGYPGDSTMEGYPNYNAWDFSEVVFPRFPMGVEECSACHGGAADGDVAAAPSREACGSCHDAVEWDNGTNHDGGAQADDALCTLCHTATEVEEYHMNPRDDASLNTGFNINIVGVTGGSGSAGQLQAGDTVSVEFNYTDDSGNALTTSDVYSATLIMSGPTTHMQEVHKNTSVQSGVTTNAAGNYVATFSLPSTFATQENAGTEYFGVEDGDWSGQPLVDGTYVVMVAGYRTFTDAGGSSQRVPNYAGMEVLVGAATTLESREVVAAEENCQSCHGEIYMHGNGRKGVDYCIMCHTAGSEDRYSNTTLTTTTPGVTVEWGTMLHKIHNGSNLSETYDIVGYASSSPYYAISNFNGYTFPRLDGGTQACAACHEGSEAYLDPQTKACTSCHDSSDAAAHAAINTDDQYGESCDVCHGEGRDFAVETMHDWLR